MLKHIVSRLSFGAVYAGDRDKLLRIFICRSFYSKVRVIRHTAYKAFADIVFFHDFKHFFSILIYVEGLADSSDM